MDDLTDTTKKLAVACTIACGAAFAGAASAQSAAAPVKGPTTLLQQAAAGSPGEQVSRHLFSAPMDDNTLIKARDDLMKLPKDEAYAARTEFHRLNLEELRLVESVGYSIAHGNSQHSIEEIHSPEMRDAMLQFKEKVDAAKRAEQDWRKNPNRDSAAYNSLPNPERIRVATMDEIRSAETVREKAFYNIVQGVVNAKNAQLNRGAPST